jgi:hypothetical protein
LRANESGEHSDRQGKPASIHWLFRSLDPEG